MSPVLSHLHRSEETRKITHVRERLERSPRVPRSITLTIGHIPS